MRYLAYLLLPLALAATPAEAQRAKYDYVDAALFCAGSGCISPIQCRASDPTSLLLCGSEGAVVKMSETPTCADFECAVEVDQLICETPGCITTSEIEDAYLRNTGDDGVGSYNFGNDLLSVDAGNDRVGVGLGAPQTNLHIQASSADVVPMVEIEQIDTGDAAIQFSVDGSAFALGIDNDDSNLFKVAYSSTAGSAVLGTNDLLALDAWGNVELSGDLGLGGSPEAPIHVVIGGASFSPLAGTAAVWQNNNAPGDSVFFSLIAGTSGNSQISFGDSDNQFASRIVSQNNDGEISVRGESKVALRTGSTNHLTATSANVAIGSGNNGSNDYLKVDAESGPPPAADCDEDSERGREIYDYTNHRKYTCGGSTRGWDYVTLTD